MKQMVSPQLPAPSLEKMMGFNGWRAIPHHSSDSTGNQNACLYQIAVHRIKTDRK